jgi:hypothetical protein
LSDAKQSFEVWRSNSKAQGVELGQVQFLIAGRGFQTMWKAMAGYHGVQETL